MNETIKLKVPKDGVTVEGNVVEELSQGNFRAQVAPNTAIEIESRQFADWLILSHGLTEIKPKEKKNQTENENPFAGDYAPDFPGREAFITAQIPLETVRGLTRDQLVTIPGIGAQTADAVLGYQPSPAALPVTAATVETEKATDDNDSTNGGEK